MDLFQAIINGQDEDAISHLIVAGNNVNYTNEEGVSCLEAAVKRGKSAIVNLLLTNGADPTLRNPLQPLYLAEVYIRTLTDYSITDDDKYATLSALLRHGLELELIDLYPCVPLLILQTIDLRLLLLLLANARDTRGRTILMIKDQNANSHFQELLDFGADPNEVNGQHELLTRSQYGPHISSMFKNSPLTYSMYTPQVTDNFKLLFNVSSSTNLATAFALAVEANWFCYQDYIVTRMFLSSIQRQHHAYRKFVDIFGDVFEIPYRSFGQDLDNFLNLEYAGGVTYLQIYLCSNVEEFLSNSKLCEFIVEDTNPIPQCLYMRTLLDKFGTLKKLCLIINQAENNLSRFILRYADRAPYLVVKHIMKHFSLEDIRSLANISSRPGNPLY
ncbi:hypothetical protein QAD02_003785 [Eretmocerus hayati]|uniref:Uncharacterized protein n=1 Tax=Eretmocerus hayati TaxID=131215 RepID=A0ACC2NNP9_9HYME|nr:hypothetical protein QAD02_003785 [Eretmocerus hayati]